MGCTYQGGKQADRKNEETNSLDIQAKESVSVEELKKAKGKPQRTYLVQEKDKNQGEIYEYPKESFQVEKGKVVYHYRQPQGSEEFLQYWLNRWKGHTYHHTLVQTQGVHIHHTPQDLQYINYDNGEMFIYSPSQEKVIEIILQPDPGSQEKSEKKKDKNSS